MSILRPDPSIKRHPSVDPPISFAQVESFSIHFLVSSSQLQNVPLHVEIYTTITIFIIKFHCSVTSCNLFILNIVIFEVYTDACHHSYQTAF
jgi:hypothetical protein